MGATAQWITQYQPRVVCFVDYPGFNLRLAKQLFERGVCAQAGGAVKLVYYISPQIWAWKAWRRFSMARTLDALAVIFPFEVDCYRDTRLPATFVGHPFVRPDHCLPVSYDPDGTILLLPGSRRVPVRRIFPVMLEAFRRLWLKHPQMTATVIYPSETIKAVLEKIVSRFEDIQARVSLVPNTQKRSGRALLTSSGTMSLACTLAGIPGAIIYKTSWPTYIFGKMIIDIKHLGIGSILLGRMVYPEFIQAQASVGRVAAELEDCALNPQRRERAAQDAQELRTLLGEGLTGMPSPAQWLGQFLDS
ncbi:MAG: hypothetical protein B7X06_00890 [Verrucomicrobia bacterium 21-51-4]|nr:MAG: hypothetical protein B7X06_00890 [Verrucomicrobia bacterium 21-51-4]